jgi:TRAP-type C4-dicarboxylate transport system permease small subunit
VSTAGRVWKGLYKPWNVVAGSSLVFMMCMTTADVIGRLFGHPIFGVYDLVGILGAVIYTAALPDTTANKGHVSVELFLIRLPSKARITIKVITSCLSIILFACIAWQSRIVGIELREAGKVTTDIELPFQYMLYFISLASFFVCIILAKDLINLFRDHTID